MKIGTTITPDRFNELKKKIKAECLRRKYTGSVSSYGGTSYDYTTQPNNGKVISKEHITKLVEPMAAINIENQNENINVIKDDDLSTLEAKITAYQAMGLTDSNTGCSAYCTGLCSTSCSESCGVQCQGTCLGSCKNTCQGSCQSTCSGGCRSTCSGSCSGCSGSCSGGCYTGCSGCSGSCTRHCANDCTGLCGGSCSGLCTSCTGTCSGTSRNEPL